MSSVREGVREPARHHVAHENALGLRGRQATLLRHLQQDLRRQGLLQVSFGPFTFSQLFETVLRYLIMFGYDSHFNFPERG